MEEEKTTKVVNAAVLGAVSAVAFAAAVTVAADLYLPLKEWLKGVFAHHWIGKSVLTIGVFTLFFAIFSFFGTGAAEKTVSRLKFLAQLALAGSLLLIGFFVWEFVK